MSVTINPTPEHRQELLRRLRTYATNSRYDTMPAVRAACDEAADHIERLEAAGHAVIASRCKPGGSKEHSDALDALSLALNQEQEQG